LFFFSAFLHTLAPCCHGHVLLWAARRANDVNCSGRDPERQFTKRGRSGNRAKRSCFVCYCLLSVREEVWYYAKMFDFCNGVAHAYVGISNNVRSSLALPSERNSIQEPRLPDCASIPMLACLVPKFSIPFDVTPFLRLIVM
jgi:hypothetical protein